MTLVIALKWLMEESEAVVVSSDSRAMYGPIAYEVRKIYPILLLRDGEQVPLAVAGGAGEASFVKYGYLTAESILKERSAKVGYRPLTYDEFAKCAREIEAKLVSRFSSLRREGIEPSFAMVLASVSSQGKASIYLFDSRGLCQPVHDNPGFAIIGKGAATGGVLLTRLLGYSPERSGWLDLGLLSAFVIDVVSEIDPEVGPFVGESVFIRIEEGKVVAGPLKEEALREFKDKVQKRKELIRLFYQLCDQKGEKEVERALKRLASKRP